MTPTPNFNPALLLAAACKAFPEYAGQWKISGRDVIRIAYEVRGNPAMRFDVELLDHAYLLQRYLRNNGWTFAAFNGEQYTAFTTAYPVLIERDKSDTMLLYKCLSAMSGLALYLE